MLPWVTKAAYGPKRFFFYSLFESDQTGAPLAVRNRAAGSVDVYAAAVGRWLVTRDGFDFLAYYLSDFDYASHAHGPEGAEDVALARTDAAIQALLDAAGGIDEFLERYAVILHSDHGQTSVDRAAQLELPLARTPTASSSPRRTAPARSICCPTRASTRRRSRARSTPSRLSKRRCGSKATKRLRAASGEELRFRRAAGGWETSGDASILDHPDALPPRWSALANPNAGELLVSAAAGWEFVDIGGRHHAGGGSHGSLVEGDSIVPVLTIGVDAPIERITDVTPAVLEHFTRVRVVADRRAMVERQLRARGIEDERVLAAMARVPRELLRAG